MPKFGFPPPLSPLVDIAYPSLLKVFEECIQLFLHPPTVLRNVGYDEIFPGGHNVLNGNETETPQSADKGLEADILVIELSEMVGLQVLPKSPLEVGVTADDVTVREDFPDCLYDSILEVTVDPTWSIQSTLS